jgi:hypothetical protein
MRADRTGWWRAALGPLATLAALTACAVPGVVLGGTGPADAADRFTQHVLRQETSALCGSMSSRLLAELGGRDGCARRWGPDRAEVDGIAKRSLADAWRAAQAARTGPAGSAYPPAGRLLRAMRPRVAATLRLGRGARAVRGRSPWFVVLAERELRAGRLVLYAESDTGTIFRLVARPRGSPVIERAAVAGIPDLASPPAGSIPYTVEIAEEAPAVARAVVTIDMHAFVETISLRLVAEDGRWLVDRVGVEVRWQPL